MDDPAVDEAYRLYAPAIWRRCAGIVRNDAAALDITHEVFVRCIRHHRSCGPGAGENGSVWFVSLGWPNEVGRVDANGTLHAYPLPATTAPTSDKSGSTIARAPDGAFWFTLPERGQLGRVSADGQLSFIQLAANSLPRGLAFDQKGRLWFTSVPGFGRIEF